MQPPPTAGVLDEKCAATSALGLYAQSCPAAFMPYVEPTLEALTKAGGLCRWAGAWLAGATWGKGWLQRHTDPMHASPWKYVHQDLP